MVDWSQCVCAAVDVFLPGFARWRYFVDMWVAEGHTPTRATRGEARGHRSVLAQNPLFMYLLLFPSFELVVGPVCPAIWWTGLNVFALLWLHSSLVSSDGVTLWTCGSPKGTQHDGPASVCCLCIASRCWCRPVSGMSTPSRCRALVHSRCQWCRDRLAHICSARLCVCVCVWRSSGPQRLPQRIGEGWGVMVQFGGI